MPAGPRPRGSRRRRTGRSYARSTKLQSLALYRTGPMFLSVPRRTHARPGAGPRGALREAPSETDRSKLEQACSGRARGRGGVLDRGRDGWSDGRAGRRVDVGASGTAGELPVLRAGGRLEIVPPDGAVPGDG